MTQAIETSKTFQEKMFERIRDQIGDLMTEEDLKKLVDAAVKQAFFEPRKIQDGYRETTKQPYFVELIQTFMSEQVKQLTTDWMTENHEEFAKAVNECIAKGFFGVIMSALDGRMAAPLSNFKQQLNDKGIQVY